MLNDSIFKINRIQKVLEEANKNDIPLYYGLISICPIIEEIILFGNKTDAEIYIQAMKEESKKFFDFESKSEVWNKIINICNDILIDSEKLVN